MATQSSPSIRSAARTHIGLVRQANEDRVLDAAQRGLWAVADGMGGHVGGAAAATTVIEALSAVIAPVTDEAIDAALERAHRAVRAEGDGRGTTIAGLTIARDRFAIFWIGDSRVYRMRAGRLERLTNDHSLVQDLVDRGLLAPELAARHPEANIITRAIGIAQWHAPERRAGEAAPGDLFLICSDGLNGLVEDHRIAALLNQPIDRAADALVAAALDAGGTDNVSVILVAID